MDCIWQTAVVVVMLVMVVVVVVVVEVVMLMCSENGAKASKCFSRGGFFVCVVCVQLNVTLAACQLPFGASIFTCQLTWCAVQLA